MPGPITKLGSVSMSRPNIFFTADLHFLHDTIVNVTSRPFDTAEEMAGCYIGEWNSVVRKQDIVYVLGDFALAGGNQNQHLVEKLLSKLQGQKHLVYGNHDRRVVRRSKGWCTVQPYKEISVDIGEPRKKKIVLSHYSMRVWNQKHYGSWMLFGHSHGNLAPYGKSFDVGVDVHGRPISLEEVKQIMGRMDRWSWKVLNAVCRLFSIPQHPPSPQRGR